MKWKSSQTNQNWLNQFKNHFFNQSNHRFHWFNQSISGYRKYIELETKTRQKTHQRKWIARNLIQPFDHPFDHQWKKMVDDLFDDSSIITIDDLVEEKKWKTWNSHSLFTFLFFFTKADISSNDLNNFCCCCFLTENKQQQQQQQKKSNVNVPGLSEWMNEYNRIEKKRSNERWMTLKLKLYFAFPSLAI